MGVKHPYFERFSNRQVTWGNSHLGKVVADLISDHRQSDLQLLEHIVMSLTHQGGGGGVK